MHCHEPRSKKLCEAAPQSRLQLAESSWPITKNLLSASGPVKRRRLTTSPDMGWTLHRLGASLLKMLEQCA
jgi:hypothetical protein